MLVFGLELIMFSYMKYMVSMFSIIFEIQSWQCIDFIFVLFSYGIRNRIVMVENIISMLFSLFGIMCNIVQYGVQYQIGLMCFGVIRWLVLVKLLCFRNRLLKFGVKKMMKVVMISRKLVLILFLSVQYGWNGILLVGVFGDQWLFLGFFLIFMLLGLFDFILCSVFRCSIISSSSISGNVMMCSVKKWLSVVLLGRQLFMIYLVRLLLIIGIVLNSEMIILVFQNDIWFYGSMQFMKVLVISIRQISMFRIYISLCGFW